MEENIDNRIKKLKTELFISEKIKEKLVPFLKKW